MTPFRFCSLLVLITLGLTLGCNSDETSSETKPAPDDRPAKVGGPGLLGSIRSAAKRTEASNNMKVIGLALHNYHDTQGNFPPAGFSDPAGQPLLSWRVAILPFMEQQNLYREFHLNEPWDSPHNKQLIARMPKEYALPGVSRQGDTETFFRVIVSKGHPRTPIDMLQGRTLYSIGDGSANTILVAEAAESVPWTKPEPLMFDPQGPLPVLGKHYGGRSLVLLADGSAIQLKEGIEDSTLRAMITSDGGEIIPR